MKILLINNNVNSRDKLLFLLKKHEVTEIPYQEISISHTQQYDAIILSGGPMYALEETEEIYKKEIELIKQTSKPLFGICLGFELIAMAYNEELIRPDQNQEGNNNIVVKQKDPILRDLDTTFTGYEHHHWSLEKTKQLIVIAKSENGIEIIKHPEQTVYGAQFHPEKFIFTTQGHTIIENFLKLVEERL
jgi:para-aminobenzoate synthetase component 2